jgi:signal transduction histidine kinase
VVELSRRPEATREAAAYFVVAEAVTNVTKHAHARRASVTIAERSGALHVVVTDDGRGGARLDPGGGLAGLASRVASLDGTFSMSSPVGGPTRIEAVIPCEP